MGERVRMITWERWKNWLKEEKYTVLPVIQAFALIDATIPSWEQVWRFRRTNKSFVLESGKSGRFSYLGLDPKSAIWGNENECMVERDGKQERWNLPPFTAVRKWLHLYRGPKMEDIAFFTGGCVGFWGYEVAYANFAQSRSAIAVEKTTESLAIPDYCFMQIDTLWIVDHIDQKLYCAVQVPLMQAESPSYESFRYLYDQAVKRTAQMKNEWDQMMQKASDVQRLHRRRSLLHDLRARVNEHSDEKEALAVEIDAPVVEAAWDKKAFVQAARTVQAAIQGGDVYQVNLSIRQSRPLRSSGEEIYEWLRLINPSPYMGLFTWDHFQLVSSSPELLVKMHHGRLTTRPIGGTRPRGHDEEEDRKYEEQLLLSEKEVAEHIMLVDLLRHDIGQIAKYGTVHVPELLTIEKYSHVMHLVSRVDGIIKDDCDVFDAFASIFPGGTITGVPKQRSMELIAQLEPVRRGPYTGSLGWIDYSGNMEFNIVIRTLVVQDGIGYVQAGAGIVNDSDPGREYEESLNKAKAIWKAIEYSEAERDESERRIEEQNKAERVDSQGG